MSEPTVSSYEIQGKTVEMPVEVRQAASGIASFIVPTSVAQGLVGDAFEVPDFLPGRTLFMLGCIDYRDNDLGDYNEVAMNFFVRKRGARGGFPYLSSWLGMGKGTLAAYAWKMPVNQSFTRDAGATIWGFPKTIERIDFAYDSPGRFGARLEMDGEMVFEINMRRGGKISRPAMDLESYSYINGIPHRTPFVATSEGMGTHFGGGDVVLSLGKHPIAETLRRLGLPRKPLMTMWTEKMKMTFQAPQKL